MALQVLTDQQKQDLRTSQNFRQFCKWAVLDKARYWTGLDGSSVPGNDWVKWAKCRIMGMQILANPYAVEDDLSLPLAFAVLLTQAVYDDANPEFNVDTVIEYMDTYTINGNPASIFDTLADLYFDQKIKSIQF